MRCSLHVYCTGHQCDADSLGRTVSPGGRVYRPNVAATEGGSELAQSAACDSCDIPGGLQSEGLAQLAESGLPWVRRNRIPSSVPDHLERPAAGVCLYLDVATLRVKGCEVTRLSAGLRGARDRCARGD